MRAYRVVSGCIAVALAAPVFADTVVYDDGELKQTYRVELCAAGEACVRKVITQISQKFVYTAEPYEVLQNKLAGFGIETSVYESSWSEPLEVNATMKINGQAVFSEIVRRDCPPCKKRRRKNANETLVALYGTARAGDVIEFVLDPIVSPINSNGFTMNVKRYLNDTVIGSQSQSWLAPIGSTPGDGSELK